MTAPNGVVVAASAGVASVSRNSPDEISIASRFIARPPPCGKGQPRRMRPGNMSRTVMGERLASVSPPRRSHRFGQDLDVPVRSIDADPLAVTDQPDGISAHDDGR